MTVIQILTLTAIAICAVAVTACGVSLNRLSRLLRETKTEVDAANRGLPEPTQTPPMPPIADQLWIEVPVTLGFDVTQPIGQLRMLRSFLPPTPDFVFSIGFMSRDPHDPPGTIPTSGYMGRYDLDSVALISDARYIGYLRQIGKLPKETE